MYIFSLVNHSKSIASYFLEIYCYNCYIFSVISQIFLFIFFSNYDYCKAPLSSRNGRYINSCIIIIVIINTDIGFRFMHLSWGHPVGRIPGTYAGRAREFLTFVTKFLVPVGLFDCFALLGAGSLRKDLYILVMIKFVCFHFLKVILSQCFCCRYLTINNPIAK